MKKYNNIFEKYKNTHFRIQPQTKLLIKEVFANALGALKGPMRCYKFSKNLVWGIHIWNKDKLNWILHPKTFRTRTECLFWMKQYSFEMTFHYFSHFSNFDGDFEVTKAISFLCEKVFGKGGLLDLSEKSQVSLVQKINEVFHATKNKVKGPYPLNKGDEKTWVIHIFDENKKKWIEDDIECISVNMCWDLKNAQRQYLMIRLLNKQKIKITDEVLELINKKLISTYQDSKSEIQNKVYKVDEVLRKRQNTHGDFSENARFSQAQKDFLPTFPSYNKLTGVQKEALNQILSKIGRILSGDPDHEDSWIDINGYSELALKDIRYRKTLKK